MVCTISSKSALLQSELNLLIINLSYSGSVTFHSTDDLMYDAYLKTVKLHWKQKPNRLIIATSFTISSWTLHSMYTLTIYSACGEPPLQCFRQPSPLDENLLCKLTYCYYCKHSTHFFTWCSSSSGKKKISRTDETEVRRERQMKMLFLSVYLVCTGFSYIHSSVNIFDPPIQHKQQLTWPLTSSHSHPFTILNLLSFTAASLSIHISNLWKTLTEKTGGSCHDSVCACSFFFCPCIPNQDTPRLQWVL